MVNVKVPYPINLFGAGAGTGVGAERKIFGLATLNETIHLATYVEE
jgi:hypothetical protein